MTQLSLSTLSMPSAHIGPQNPLPQMRSFFNLSSAADVEGAQAKPETAYPDKGSENIILPYRLQDQYDRAREKRSFKTAVLENDILKATFLLDLGGRLLSLVHKPTNRELLYVNPVFQPANFAVRDAWFTGGVEWNIGILGHCVFTCAPLFAARVESENGPVLRFYEFERIRRVTFQVDVSLPQGSSFLMVYVRIINPHDHGVPMYWWSNIAVPEDAEHRVLSPANEAFRHAYTGNLDSVKVPRFADYDATYVTNAPHCADLYFKIPQGHRHWITSLDKQGRGLIQASTPRLKGRKLWCWGNTQGSHHWQDFLAEPGEAYLEIQAGLTVTQSEYVTMPAFAKWSWVEAYGLMEADAKKVHGSDWAAACDNVETTLDRTIPRDRLEKHQAQGDILADKKPAELLHTGSGWGALERLRRAKSPEQYAGQEVFPPESLPFPDSTLGEEQAQWLALLNEGALPQRPPTQEPGSFLVQRECQALLEESVRTPRGDHWLTWLHLGIMRRRHRDRAGAKAAWEKSLERAPNAWAYRNLADITAEDGDAEGAAALWLAAAKLLPTLTPLIVETCHALLNVGKPVTLLALLKDLPDSVRAEGRVQLLETTAHLELGDTAAAEKFFAANSDGYVIVNLREGEMSLGELWYGWKQTVHERKIGRLLSDEEAFAFRQSLKMPKRFDFSMRPDTSLPATAYRPGRRVKEKT